MAMFGDIRIGETNIEPEIPGVGINQDPTFNRDIQHNQEQHQRRAYPPPELLTLLKLNSYCFAICSLDLSVLRFGYSGRYNHIYQIISHQTHASHGPRVVTG